MGGIDALDEARIQKEMENDLRDQIAHNIDKGVLKPTGAGDVKYSLARDDLPLVPVSLGFGEACRASLCEAPTAEDPAADTAALQLQRVDLVRAHTFMISASLWARCSSIGFHKTVGQFLNLLFEIVPAVFA